MNGHKIAQLQSKIHTHLSDIILNEVNNKDASQASIIEVKLSGDGSIVTVYVNFYQNTQKGLEALNKAKGFIRTQLAQKINTRRTPILLFKLDNKLEEINSIEKLIEENN